ncbi:L-threonylcarbamoyladenylate synthase [Pusillimonas noertemannii]|uniref:L-threonylcarbamoyladenylate synthase n=1 Tax=Pusillimonas noertemannii TaxID=305977 RepID=UPI0002E8D0A4|nr:L-threonylcarbamoyladenylate synthase [Pusillimonas noertemannii]
MNFFFDDAMEAEIQRAAQRLLEGRLVAFPTETVYGLGADAENVQAIARIYAAKGRPANHPVIVHLAPGASLEYWAARVPPQAQKLIDAFWPGPLTLILPRAERIPAAVAGGQDSIGLRCPSHPVAQALLRRFAELKGGHGGVAAPSANQFGQVSPTLAEHVRAEFPGMPEDELLILEGGASEVGIESTILDLSRLEQGVGPVVLRPGHITAAQMGEVLGLAPESLIPGEAGEGMHDSSRVEVAHQRGGGGLVQEPLSQARAGSQRQEPRQDQVQDRAQSQAPRVSGSLKAHYAPRTPLQVSSWDGIQKLADAGLLPGQRLACIVFERPEGKPSSVPGIDWFVVKAEPHAYARELYALLRRLDQDGYARLVFEQPPRSAPWRAVNDRLGRAAAAFDVSLSK